MVMKTRRIVFSSQLLQEPFIQLHLMLDVILAACFGLNAMQISFLTAMRPTLSVFAFYWGSALLFRPQWLRPSLVLAVAAAPILFLFAPFNSKIWFFIAAEAIFILFWRAAKPAQIEIIKINVEKGAREILFSNQLNLSRASAIIIGPLLGLFVKMYPTLWKELFAVAALLYSSSAILQHLFSMPSLSLERREKLSFREIITRPWVESFELLRRNKAFAHYKLGFFIAGAGLMFMKPSIPGFLTASNLSFLAIFSLFTLLEGAGFILASRFWSRTLAKNGIHMTSSWVAAAFSLQPLLLIFSSGSALCIYAAFFIYGVAQSGSQLVWTLSGPYLCGSGSSSQYSSVNILAIAIRGLFAPLLGGLFTTLFGAQATFSVGFATMVLGSWYLFYVAKKLKTVPEPS
jgi:hypothetical protein